MYFCSLTHPPVLDESHRNSGELKVETGGTLTLADRVKMAMVSGMKIDAQRYLESFDVQEDGSVELIIPSARRPGYDIVDGKKDLDAMRKKYTDARQKKWDAQKTQRKAESDRIQNEHIEKEILKREKAREAKKTE